MRDYGPVSRRLFTRERNRHGRSHRVLRRLDLFGSQWLTGYQRRLFMAEVATELCKAAPVKPNDAFGGDETVLKGLHESRQAMRCLENFAARGRLRSEEKDPQLAADIRAIAEPHTHADPQLKSSRRYSNLSAA